MDCHNFYFITSFQSYNYVYLHMFSKFILLLILPYNNFSPKHILNSGVNY